MDKYDIIKELKYSIFLRAKELIIANGDTGHEDIKNIPEVKRLYDAIDVIDEIISK